MLVCLTPDILGTEDLVVEATANDAVRFYPWTIDNKYYSADINLCVVPNKFLVTAEIAESVQAFVVYFDSTQQSGLDSVSAWLPLAEAWLPEVMILVCDRVSENGVNRQKAQEWCIKHGFELVELSPEELPEEDDDFPESTGVKRIVQALNANVWSNVVMKNDRNQGFSLLSSLAGANHSIASADTCHSQQPCLPAADRTESLLDHRGGAANTADAQVDSIVDPMLDLDIQELASLTTGGGDLENFERLFSKLKEMKVLEHPNTPDSLVLLDEFLKIYFPPRQGCDASSRAEKVACRKGCQSLLDGNWGRQR
ncbi:alpha- and gamma-adaptin-binding protein p34 isoform X1 [Sturnira hondurensis]|uniref:alpha- and gamma-adaptin-binding protein p34 isoform X1 n=1 Tax=Sturnira hondurensis TaxID=192404 RepID=UPI0018790F8B|nr:alpha- and gamma-adaptin-binding protein p34 isoform X1 [Sturnira hondurensis]